MSSVSSNRRSTVWLRLASLTLALAVSTAGCLSDARPILELVSQAPHQEATTSQQTNSASQTTIIGTSVEGRPIACRTLGDGPDVTLFIATIHGNEFAGTSLLERLGDYLAGCPELLVGRRVVLIPLANPDGFAYRTRHNAQHVDLNRNFPAGNWLHNSRSGESPLSEPESQALHDLLHLHQPHRVVTIHETLACIDYDGPGEPLAQAMAAQCDLPVRKLGGLPGSLGSYFSKAFDRPIVTVELRRFAHQTREDDLWNCYREMLLTAITFQNSKIAVASE
jgi:protein MpaA